MQIINIYYIYTWHNKNRCVVWYISNTTPSMEKQRICHRIFLSRLVCDASQLDHNNCCVINRDNFMVSECVWFLLTSCEGQQNEQGSKFVILHEWIKSYKQTNHEVICLLYEYWDIKKPSKKFPKVDHDNLD